MKFLGLHSKKSQTVNELSEVPGHTFVYNVFQNVTNTHEILKHATIFPWLSYYIGSFTIDYLSL